MSKRVLAFTITRSDSPTRKALLERTLEEGGDKAGYPLDWAVWDNSEINRGQHVAFNHYLAKAVNEGYDYLLRVDDDVEFMSQRWLAKMVEASEALGPQYIVSPTVNGLKHPPEMSQMVEVSGQHVKFLPSAIGGACRLHPVALLANAPTPYVSDVRLPMGMGDATGIMAWAEEMFKQQWPVWAVWLVHVNVKHATARQEREDGEYHSLHGLYQRVPYMPAWSGVTSE